MVDFRELLPAVFTTLRRRVSYLPTAKQDMKCRSMIVAIRLEKYLYQKLAGTCLKNAVACEVVRYTRTRWNPLRRFKARGKGVETWCGLAFDDL